MSGFAVAFLLTRLASLMCHNSFIQVLTQRLNWSSNSLLIETPEPLVEVQLVLKQRSSTGPRIVFCVKVLVNLLVTLREELFVNKASTSTSCPLQHI